MHTITRLCAAALIASAPLALHAADPYRYGFDGTTEGWANFSPSIFTNPIPSASNSSLSLKAKDNTNTFGYWYSPITAIPTDPFIELKDEQDPDQIIFFFSRLYRASWFVLSDVTTRTEVPQIRLRSYRSDFSESIIQTIESNADGAYSPGPLVPLKENEKQGVALGFYDQLIYQREGNNDLGFSFDLLNFSPSDDPNGEISLTQLSIQQINYPSGSSTTSKEWNLGSVNPGFESGTAFPFGAPSLFRDSRGLVARAFTPLKDGQDKTNIIDTYFGYWSYNSGIPIEANSVYEVIFRVGSNLSEARKNEFPVVRLRVNDSSFQGSWYLNIDSQGTDPYVPHSGTSRTYHLFFYSPFALTGNDLIFSFDYLWTISSDNDPSAAVWLEYLRVDRYEDTTAPTL